MNKDTTLLTADWIGIWLAIIGLIGGVLGIVAVSLVGLGVFGPSVLRELGWLDDADEYTRRAMYRAGFHTAILLAFYLTINRILDGFATSLPAPFGQHGLYIALEHMVQMSWVVFAVSYVAQYWGPRLGVTRVLFGFGAYMAAYAGQALVRQLIVPELSQATFIVSCLVIGALCAGMAMLVRARPRAGGYILLGLLALVLVGTVFNLTSLDSMPEHVKDQGIFWAYLQGALAGVILLGPMGVSLVRDREDALV